MKNRPISTIRFFLEKVSTVPESGDIGFHKINGEWLRDRVEINGVQPDSPAIDIKEFYRMLQKPGDYEPFTCTCGNSGCADIDFSVRCRHKENLVIMVIRDPLRRRGECQNCEFEHNEEQCPAEHIFWRDCPFIKFHYRAHIFRRQDIERELLKSEKAHRDPLRSLTE